MPRRKAQKVTEIVPVVSVLPTKKPRGRPRKSTLDITDAQNLTETSNGYPMQLYTFIKNGVNIMKIKTYREAIEELTRIHAYLSASIAYGQLNGYKKPSQQELIELLASIFK